MSMLARKRKARAVDTEDWIATYADAITLLLCFFVILLAISEPNMSKFEDVKKGLLSEFFAGEPSTPFTDLFQGMSESVKNNDLEEDVLVEETESGISFEFASSLLFESGSANFKPEALSALEEIAYALKDFEYAEYHITVEGHTDDSPITTEMFPSNWELSAARASIMVRFLVEQGIDPTLLSAEAFADTQPKVPNLDVTGAPIPENRAANRRIVVNLNRGLK